MKTLAALALASFICTTVASAQSTSDWPRWRGPRDNGSAENGSYPVTWDATNNLAWKVSLPGKGCSTPIVIGHKIILTAPVSEPAGTNDAVLAFDDAGKLLWRTAFGSERAGKNKNGSGCNPSPASDGRGIFVCFKSGTLGALELDGKVRWKTNLLEHFGADNLYWDFGTSPVVTEKNVVIALMRHGNSWLIAFDKVTGQVRWKVARDFTTADEGDHSYATPQVIQQQGREALLVWGGEHLTAHDAADGRTLWSCGEFNPKAVNLWPAVASPVVVGDMAVVSYARGEILHGIKLGGAGDVTATHRLWKREKAGAFVPTPSEYKGLVYILRDSGGIQCVKPGTGEILWAEALPRDESKYYASPLIADGKMYAVREDGVIYVARIEGKFSILSTIEMGDRMIASPVPLAGRLLLRGEKFLYCVKAPQ